MARIVARHGVKLESLFLNQDPGRSGTIPVRAFSQCLRAFDAEPGGSLGRGREEAVAVVAAGAGEKLTRADRKVLYRKWAVGGRVRYGDFLRESGYRPEPLPAPVRRVSDGSGARPRKHRTQPPTPAPQQPPALSRQKHGDDDDDVDSDGDGGGGEDDSRGQESKGSSTDKKGGENEDEGVEAEGLLERAKVVLVHLSEVRTPPHPSANC